MEGTVIGTAGEHDIVRKWIMILSMVLLLHVSFSGSKS